MSVPAGSRVQTSSLLETSTAQAIQEEFPLSVSANTPLCFLFTPAVPPRRRPCDAGRCGYLVVQRSHRREHRRGGHPRPLPRLAPAEPAAVEQTRQRTVYHVRDRARRRIHSQCVFVFLANKKRFSSSSFRGVDFDGSTVGLANTNAMCTANSGAVNQVDILFFCFEQTLVTIAEMHELFFTPLLSQGSQHKLYRGGVDHCP